MVEVTLVSPADCPNCADVKEQLSSLQRKYAGLNVKTVDAFTPEGEALILQHGIMASPGILINGEFFSMGAVSEQELNSAVKSAVGAA